jgi:catechol 2,3-dioxygenase-like lactoylglutathione lyase family enzyme
MENSSEVRSPQITRVILYVRNIPKVAAFYQRVFGMRPLPGAAEGWLELAGPTGGCTIALHQGSVAQKSGAAMKLVFGVADVRAFKSATEKEGVKFGVIHHVVQEGVPFEFSNAKDPAGNSISISSRGLAKKTAWRGRDSTQADSPALLLQRTKHATSPIIKTRRSVRRVELRG